MTYSPEWNAWRRAKQRVSDPNNKAYLDYGGRGIKMSQVWIESFAAFYDHIGPKPEPKNLYSLDRINNDGNYEPGNVRWATKSQQMRNRRPFIVTRTQEETIRLDPRLQRVIASEYGIDQSSVSRIKSKATTINADGTAGMDRGINPAPRRGVR